MNIPQCDKGAIYIARDTDDAVVITVRSPGAYHESKISLPFEIWQRIAVPPCLAVSMAGDMAPAITSLVDGEGVPTVTTPKPETIE